MILEYLEQPTEIPLVFLCKHKSERRFAVNQDIFVTLSDGYVLKIEKGFETDLSSIPGWLWSIAKPIDSAFIGDLIHDKLWVDKKNQLERHNFSIFEARKFADDERMKWRKGIAPKKKLKNWITHRVIRWIGGFFYSRQLTIPE
ncbi:hypothetical protein HWC99_gp58 [Flavobacterium phage vB_FspS_tant8-1]|uniref:DUF1353 domain-containing protein n=1 Tax=Flavobacterium phage vB_FspS_tant8-1 TaxID=2686278 RepID=A0A6B9LVF8_9CAUD|nr:hypothetical protein HWC99_gp58 [Flavobacterium phage vB_FspS_tant8-1]QHB40989.1 hypothetical protein tant81_gp058 [Flavobacterium phage vB_FspS_tant8-1]